jgi:hypothetical protein
MQARNFRVPSEAQDHQNENPVNLGTIPQVPQADSTLLELDTQFTVLMSEILATERESKQLVHNHSTATDNRRPGHAELDEEAATRRIESVLSRLERIERGIMLTSANTIVGLAVKARHAAYVTSEYWNAPIDRFDWDAKAIRLLIEAVCKMAQMPLPFRDRDGESIERTSANEVREWRRTSQF